MPFSVKLIGLYFRWVHLGVSNLEMLLRILAVDETLQRNLADWVGKGSKKKQESGQ